MDFSTAVLIGIPVLGTVAGFVSLLGVIRGGFRALPADVQVGIRRAKESRKEYRQLTKAFGRRVMTAADQLAELESPKGRMLKRVSGVTLYERWIDTPQGGGSLLGVKAEAVDESGIGQCLAMRMPTLGPFSLAAPKNKATAHAYVVFEGPRVSGFATIRAANKAQAGPAASSFAADINSAARAAESTDLTRLQAIEAARLSLAQAKDHSDVAAASSRYAQAVAVLPPERRLKFKDVPPQAQVPPPEG